MFWKKKLYGPFFWMGFNCLKAAATLRSQFTFYHSAPRNSWYSFYRPPKDERLSRLWSHPVVLNTEPLDWESSALTTRCWKLCTTPYLLLSNCLSLWKCFNIFVHLGEHLYMIARNFLLSCWIFQFSYWIYTVCMCIWVCVCVCVCVYVYVLCMCKGACVYVYLYVYIYIYMYVYMSMCICVYVYVCMYICL